MMLLKVDTGADTPSAGGTAELVKCGYSESARSCKLGRCWQIRLVEKGPWTGGASGKASDGGGEA